VIDNLLDNARVHAPGSAVRVEVSRHSEERPCADAVTGDRDWIRRSRADLRDGSLAATHRARAGPAVSVSDCRSSSDRRRYRGTWRRLRVRTAAPSSGSATRRVVLPTLRLDLTAKRTKPGFGTAEVAPTGGRRSRQAWCREARSFPVRDVSVVTSSARRCR
jgi:hypothetical protein